MNLRKKTKLSPSEKGKIMEEMLQTLFAKCIEELNSIGISTLDIGDIDVSISKRATKRYGCCKQEVPIKQFKTVKKVGFRKIIRYERFNKHHIEISNWVLGLDESIIKNTMMHEIIHCFPYCNNHGAEFKKYASIINRKLGYNITRLGNKEEDCKKSNVEYIDKKRDKYKIECKNCGQIFFRQRCNKNISKRYRCGKCGGKLEVTVL